MESPCDGSFKVLMRTNKVFTILLNIKEEIMRVDRIKTAYVEKVSTKSLNQTGNPIANTATKENTYKSQKFDIPNNTCVLLGCLMKKRQKFINTDKWRRQERQTILSQVYSIHKQPIKLSTHQITNIEKKPNGYFIIT